VASSLKNLSNHDSESVPSAAGMKFGVIVSEWNTEITEALFNGVNETLLKYGARIEDIVRRNVPGSFELTLGAQLMANRNEFDAIICLGVVIQGETKHFDFICDAVGHGITKLNIKYNLPVIFGVLTTNSIEEAIERAGTKAGNKGFDCSLAVLEMIHVLKNI
jgi:6,7-dimethyl-8-ribityllumazine synthase